ncbi:ParA family partition ATPase [Roseicyclus sp. F158]|uniref:ParA family partition ATPase n=1 Tax=Tropicimonas omnivorans TaxID=3075590 RepID=A0ABU3DDS5_9RHOB|nr:ParA family partition ATPase [Roseicyclus sp. F158]MDT0681877.1 ParA family partition ATPase [Roseicyclus sp. F158]
MAGRTITLAQQKGGSGKTTLAANLACAYRLEGRRVALLDTDPQGSLGRWFMTRRDALGEADMEFSTASAWGVSYEVEKLRRENDVVIVDTPPKVDADLRPALREADLVLVPVSASHLDLWATESVLELAKRERRTTLLVLNRAGPGTRLTATISESLKELGAEIAETVLGNRVAYAESLGRGRAAPEEKRAGAARAEIAALSTEIARLIGLA